VQDFKELVRSRRTHKAFYPEPVSRELLEELFELARWAPNHHLTNPWRFRVLGPHSLAALIEAAGPDSEKKLQRASTLIVASSIEGADELETEENFAASAVATYILLLSAHHFGLAGYWRTPKVLRTPSGRTACQVPDSERVIGLIHLGRARDEKSAPARAGLDEFRTYLS
jgi:nitroreductase